MTNNNLFSAQISTLFPRLRDIIQMKELLSQFLYLIQDGEYFKIQNFVKDQFTDILLDVLKEDENFISLAKQTSKIEARKFLLNYFIINFSSYIKLKTQQVLERYAQSFKFEVILDLKLDPQDVLLYYRLLKVRLQQNVPILDIAKTLITLQFWEILFEWIGLQDHLCYLKNNNITQNPHINLVSIQVQTDFIDQNQQKYSPNKEQQSNQEQNQQYNQHQTNYSLSLQHPSEEDLYYNQGLDILIQDFDWQLE